MLRSAFGDAKPFMEQAQVSTSSVEQAVTAPEEVEAAHDAQPSWGIGTVRTLPVVGELAAGSVQARRLIVFRGTRFWGGHGRSGPGGRGGHGRFGGRPHTYIHMYLYVCMYIAALRAAKKII